MGIAVKRSPIRFGPEPNRVIARFFMPGSPAEVEPLLRHIVDMPEEEAREMAARILRSFAPRHRDVSSVFANNFAHLQTLVTELEIPMDSLSDEKKLVIGAYFTNEYSIEAAALFNPSAVLDPDQEGVEKGQTRLILSFRATGEGHISSIVFRCVLIDKNGKMTAVKPGRFTGQAERVRRHVYDKGSFIEKLGEMKIRKDVVSSIMDRLGDTFIYGELLGSIAETLNNDDISYSRRKVIESMTWLAESHYEISFNKETALSERVIFPTSYSETNGIEDARFVRFVDDDGTVDYYATYTAYNGFTILPKLLRTRDFLHFQVKPLHGEYAANKGMALFPRKVGGRYVMLSRVDGFNNFLMFSDNLHVWTEAVKFHPHLSVGARQGGELRFSARNGTRMAGDHPRHRSGPGVLARGVAP